MTPARDHGTQPQVESITAPDAGDTGEASAAAAQSFFDADASGIGSELVATLLAQSPAHALLAAADPLAGDVYDGDVALATADGSFAIADLGDTLDALATSADLFDVPAIDTGFGDDAAPA
jgi:hypothetical protein